MAARRLTLALVTETYPPEINGVAMTLGRLVDGCKARGHHVQIVRPRQKHESRGHQSGGDLLTRGLPLPRYPELRFGLPVWRVLEEAWREELPDIVHIATEGPLGFAALDVARRMDIPVISTFHTNFHTYTRHYGIGWLHGSIERYLRWFHNRTEQTLAPTRAMAHDLEGRAFERIGVLSRGVDTRLFHPSRRCVALRAQWGATDDTPVCLIVSRLAPEKNIDLALRAYEAIRAEHPEARMVCVGDGPLLKRLSREHPVCHFAGARRGEDLASHFASADLFLFPSLTETFGNVVSEALASGLPVVAYAQAAAAELVVPGQNGWLAEPGEEAAFIAMARRGADEIGLRTIGQRTEWRDTIAQSVRHLDWEKIHNSYEETLHAAIHSRQMRNAPEAQIRFVPD